MSRAVFASVAGAVVVLAAACSNEIHRPPPAEDPETVQPGRAGGGGQRGDGGIDGGSVADAGADALGPCNTLTITGVLVDQQAVAGSPPTGTGGAIADGLYDLTETTLFVGPGAIGPTGKSFRETLAITGGTWQQARVTITSAGQAQTQSTFTAAVSGSSVALSETCPTPSLAESFTYTVAGNQLRLISPSRQTEFVYTQK